MNGLKFWCKYIQNQGKFWKRKMCADVDYSSLLQQAKLKLLTIS